MKTSAGSNACFGMRMRWLGPCLLFWSVGTMTAFAESVPVKVTVDTTSVVRKIPADFLGFGYETSAVAQPGFFAGDNARMIQLYRTLTPTGLIRIGGNVSDYSRYEPAGTLTVNAQGKPTVINDAALKNLGEFARATGWKVMWGLNLKTGTKEEAADEAVAVDKALGDRLQSFEVGNEVDLMLKYGKDYPGWHAAYLDYKTAIRAKLPNAVFSGPDVAGNLGFVEKFVAAESTDIASVTHHYYRTDVSNPQATMDRLLLRDDRFDARLDKLQALCDPAHVGYRINEVNSFSGGGKPGVSDTFASALWSLDFQFDLASRGCAGVNIETDINHRAFVSYYSPIVHDQNMVCTARPEYYGLLAFSLASHGSIVKTTLDGRAYPMTRHGFARRRRFEWVEQASDFCSLELRDDAETRASYPFPFRLALTYRIHGDALRVEYGLTNPGTETLPASLGAHPAFRWPLRGGAQTDYRIEFATPEPAPICRLHGGMLDTSPQPTPIDGGTLQLDPTLFEQDAIMMLEVRSRSLLYLGPDAGLEFAWEGFPHLGIWQKPGAELVCIEPWHGYASPAEWDGDFQDKPGIMLVKPGETRTFSWTVRPL